MFAHSAFLRLVKITKEVRHEEALEKLRTAVEAHKTAHTLHTLGHQYLILASRAEEQVVAYDFVGQAEAVFKEINSQPYKSYDFYPEVTWSLGHINRVKKFEGDEAARPLASIYAQRLIDNKDGLKLDKAAEEAKTTLAVYASTGVWREAPA